MPYESPYVYLNSSDGYEVATQNNIATPVGTRGILSAGSDGTNTRFILVDGTARQVIVGAGTAGTPAGGILSIQGITGGTPVPISGTVTATNPSVTTTGTTIPTFATFIGGSVSTSSPAYTTGQLNALSLTTTGLLRIDGSNVTQPVSGTLTANIGTTNGLALDTTLTGGNQRTKITDGTNNAAVKAASSSATAADPSLVTAFSPNSPLPVGTNSIGNIGLTPDTISTGTLTATGQTAVVALSSAWQTTTWQITGTWTGTINFEKSIDGVNYTIASFYDGTQSNAVNSTTTNSIFFGSASGTAFIRLRTSGTWTGTATWTNSRAYGTKAAVITDALPSGTNILGSVSISGSLPAGTNTIGNVNLNGLGFPFLITGNLAAGTATAGNPLLMGGSDGTNIRYIRTDSLGNITTSQASDATLNGSITTASTFGQITTGFYSNTVPTAGSFVSITLNAQSSLEVGVPAGAWTGGGFTTEATTDGTYWFTVFGTVPGYPNFSSLITVLTHLRFNCSTWQAFRIRAITGTTITTAPTVRIVASYSDPGPISDFIANRLTDGFNNFVIKGASTAAVVGDAAIVVALSPNSPLPAGNNNIGSVTPANDDVANGTFTATGQNQSYLVNSGRSSISWQFTGTWTGTINFEKSLDGTTWVPMAFYSGTDTTNSTSINGIFYSSLGSTQWIRTRTSGTWTGTANWYVARSEGIKAVAIQDSLPTGTNAIGSVSLTSDTTSTGTITATAQTAVISLTPGWSSTAWQLTGTWTGTVNFEKSVDGTNWTTMSFYDANVSNATNAVTANGIYFASAGAMEFIRLRSSGTWTGTLTWTNSRSFGQKSTTIQDALPSGSNTIGNVGYSSLTTASVTSVAGSITAVTLLNSNTNRDQAIIVNDSSSILYVKYGTAATSALYTYKLVANATLELPQPIYTGIITGIWATATGAARITEVTP